jgi:hypothetical protein
MTGQRDGFTAVQQPGARVWYHFPSWPTSPRTGNLPLAVTYPDLSP